MAGGQRGRVLVLAVVGTAAALGLFFENEGGLFSSLTKSGSLSKDQQGLVLFADAASENQDELKTVLKAAKRRSSGDNNLRPSQAKRLREPYAQQKEALLEELEQVLQLVRESRITRGLNPDDIKPHEVIEAVKHLKKEKEKSESSDEGQEEDSSQKNENQDSQKNEGSA